LFAVRGINLRKYSVMVDSPTYPRREIDKAVDRGGLAISPSHAMLL
jgi:hypothetical protein